MSLPEVRVPYTVVEFQETPNPNALKCVLDKPVAQAGEVGLRSYLSQEAAALDPFAAGLFAVPGVVGVLVHQSWVTVSKRPEAEWKSVKAGVKKVLIDAP